MDRQNQLLFIHHSVGRMIMKQGRLRAKLAEARPDIALWDHDYNKRGVTAGDGKTRSAAFPIPDDNTDPDGLLEIMKLIASGADAAEHYLSFSAIAMKSCYPMSNITSDDDFASLQNLYLDLFETMGRIDRQFILLTSPPLAPSRTSPEAGQRALAMANWLRDFATPQNVGVFDLHSLLARPPDDRWAGTLRREYRLPLPWESHPNPLGCSVAASALASFLATELSTRR